MKKYIFSSIALLVLIGCDKATPFDPTQLTSVVVDNKTFNIPSGAIASPHIANKKEIDFFKKSGVSNCQYGDITWEAPSASQMIAKAIKNGDSTIHAKLAKEGKIGCATPIK
jgi:hypothetical protein